MATTIRMETGKLKTIVKGGSRKAMYRASALLMRMARQKIRYRSYRRASEPGMPPFKHRTGANSFSHSILFGVDASATTAVIGPQKEMKPDNPGGPVPHTLEFGGRISAKPNVFWWQKKNAPLQARSVSSVAAWLQQQGWGPLIMGKSFAEVQSQAKLAAVSKVAKNKKGKGLTPEERIRRKRAPDFSRSENGNYRLVYYYPIRIKTARQANRAAKNIVDNFGYPSIAASSIAARPFMGPTLRENEGKILPFWKDLT